MRLQDTSEQAAFRQRLRDWLARNTPEISRDDFEARKAWQNQLFKGGWLGLSWPAEHGGRGASLGEQFIYNEELARAEAPAPANSIGLMIAGPAIIACGSEAQKQRYLGKILSAEEIWCQGFSEPNAGSDLAALSTRAVDDGDHYRVTGQKIWSSYSPVADLCLVLARTEPDAPKHQGITAMAMDMKAPGVSVKPLTQITGESEFGEIFLDDVRIPKDSVIGPVNGGWIVAMKTFTRERANIAMMDSLRLAGAFERLKASVAGTSGEIDPTLRRRMARTYVDVEMLRLNCERFGEQLYGFHSSMIKVAWAETNQALQELGLSTLGPDVVLTGDGDRDTSWSFGFLRSRGNSIEGGTSEILRTIMAERILGLPRK